MSQLLSSDARPDAASPLYLDRLPLEHGAVGYGLLGRDGELGYEGKRVVVRGRHYERALSAHAPSRLTFRLDGRFRRFHCWVAINDDVGRGASDCHFAVLADGRQVCLSTNVSAGAEPLALSTDVTGAQTLELLVTTNRWAFCHSIWLDPRLDCVLTALPSERLTDCLCRAEIAAHRNLPHAARCIATVATGSFAPLLDDMLGSLIANGRCQDALRVVFSVGDDAECRRIAAKYGAVLIPCVPRTSIAVSLKSVLYSVACLVDADQYLCLDADMLVLQDLRPVFHALEACPNDRILVCREGDGRVWQSLEDALTTVYGGSPADLARMLGTVRGEGSYSLVVNDGLFAGSRAALLALDDAIRGMPNAIGWVEQRRDIWWRNQFVFNLALACLDCGVELDPTYNVQLQVNDVELAWDGGRLRALWHGRTVRVLHFSGIGRRKYPDWRGLFARVPDPLVGAGDGDLYDGFCQALRSWLGHLGVQALTWSFYGRTDAVSAHVRDPSVFPLLALLHYLIRANGCIRVVEAGTAKGVSTACIASALAHREGARIVTFDPTPHAERLTLWESLPPRASACIEQRICGSLEGMSAALAAAERYEAALLDSIHSEEHVWAEFQLATQLVCPRGLILIHDALYQGGSVEGCLVRIEAAGYGVVRLWAAERGIREDDCLGLAVIENHRRPRSQCEQSGTIPMRA